jgi:predicted glycoside hydrolase/deacetylase ChbG (UPF0249 family)
LGVIPCEFESRPGHDFMLEKNKRENLVITADDFGKSEKANRNILELAKAGKLDRVAVMTDGEISSEEIRDLIASGVKIDIHLELDWQKKRRELMKDHTLKQSFIFLLNYFRSGRGKNISDQWANQVEIFRNIFGRYPDGINSHEYVHFFPAYFKIALELGKKYQMKNIRLGKKGFLGKRTLAHLILNNLCLVNRKYFRNSNVNSSDFFVSLDWISNIDNFLEKMPKGKIEIAVHPEREKEFDLIGKYF